MRNFKKILSLVLAMAMMLSVMVVGAGAAFKDEGDFSEEYVTAAEALTNLGVLWGYEDGSFQPQDSITRAETAALIYRMTTGDVTDANKGNYTNMTNGFTDVKSADWFAGYVNFCANAQYVAGYGDGKFGPQDKVTGYQTLAMILRAVGYDKPDEFTGADWEVKTASFAQKLGILDNVKGSEKLGEPASRELVAELLFQAMANTELVHYAPFWGYVGQDFTLGQKQFELKQVEGVVFANEEANLGKDANAALEDGKTCIYEGGKTYNFYNLTTGTDIIGEQVTVWVADDTAVSTPISKADTTTEWSNTSVKHFASNSDELKAFKEDVAGHVWYNNYNTGDVLTGKGIYVKVIDNGTGFDDYVLTEKQTLDAVKYIKNDGNIIFKDQAPTGDDQFAYDGVARGDVVLTIAFDGNMFIDKASYITGQMTKYVEAHGDADDWATINGEQYTQSDINMKKSTATGLTEFVRISQTFNDNYNNLNYNYYLDSYGNIKAFEAADADALEYALVLDFDFYKSGPWAADQWVKFLTADGNVQTMVTDEVYGGFYRGAVVEFKTNADGLFEIVDKTSEGYGFPYNFIGDQPVKDEVAKITKDGLVKLNKDLYEASDDFVAFYYWNDWMGNVYYDVKTGADALADIEGKYVVQKDAEASNTHTDPYGDIYMVNIAGCVSPATQYCYVTDTITDTVELVDGSVYYYYPAVNEAGEEITVAVDDPFDTLPAGPARVFNYVQHTFNTLDDGVVTLNVLVNVDSDDLLFADVHPWTEGKFVAYELNETHKKIGTAENPAVFVNVDEDDGALGEAVTLSEDFCTTAILVLDGKNVLAAFVTDLYDGDDFSAMP